MSVLQKVNCRLRAIPVKNCNEFIFLNIEKSIINLIWDFKVLQVTSFLTPCPRSGGRKKMEMFIDLNFQNLQGCSRHHKYEEADQHCKERINPKL